MNKEYNLYSFCLSGLLHFKKIICVIRSLGVTRDLTVSKLDPYCLVTSADVISYIMTPDT